jgi:hypothetical protein
MKKIQKLTLILILIFYYAPINASAESIYGLKYLVEYSITECSKDYPLKVTIKNHTLGTLKYTSFYIEATPHGYSTTKYLERYHWEKIIKRFNTETLCYPIIGSDISLKDLSLSGKSSLNSEEFD